MKSIKFKILALIIAFLAFTIIENLTILLFINKQKEDALLINIAGRQRMLTQKITKNVNLLLSDHKLVNEKKDKIKKECESALNLFDKTLNAFNNGGFTLTPDGKKIYIESLKKRLGYTPNELKKLNYIWEKFKTSIRNIESTNYTYEDVEFIYNNNNKLLSLSNDIVNILQKASEKYTSYIFYTLIWGIIFTFILYIIISNILNKYIISPISEITKDIKDLSNGDLSKEFNIDTQDEIGTMASNLKSLQYNLNRIINNVKNTLNRIYADFETLKKGIETSNLQIVNIKSDVEKSSIETSSYITQVINEINTSIKTTVDTIERMIKNIEDETELINHTSIVISKLIKEIEDVAIKAQNEKENLISITDKIQNMNNKLEDALQIMINVKENSQGMLEIIKLITEIADQTDILAINAAIEAANSESSSGSGFKVIAEEIRELSQAIAKNIKQISSNVEQNLKSIDSATNSTKNIKQEFSDITDKIIKISDNIVNIIEDLNKSKKESSDVIHSINSLTESHKAIKKGNIEIKTEIGELNKNITLLNNIKSKLDHMMNLLNNSFEKILSQSNNLIKISEVNKKNIEELRKILEFFKLKNN